MVYGQDTIMTFICCMMNETLLKSKNRMVEMAGKTLQNARTGSLQKAYSSSTRRNSTHIKT
jgi:hypothetical protein